MAGGTGKRRDASFLRDRSGPGGARVGTGETEFTLLNDEPNVDDSDPLGYDRVAADLAGAILRSRRASPLTLGIEGGWGSGKSSLMRKLASRLDQDRSVTTVWFNAWAAEGSSALEGLIKTVLQRIDPRIVRRASRQARIVTAARAASMMAAHLLGIGRIVDVVWEQVSTDAQARQRPAHPHARSHGALAGQARA